jgi:hypothetical protein
VETDFEEPYNGLEIVEQSELDHFNAILQEAQRLAAKAEKDKPRKRPKIYYGNSKRTLKRQKNYQEDLAKQGQLSLFGYMAHMENKVKERAHLERLVARTLESEQVSDLESEAEALVSERVNQVRRRELLMH